MDITEANGIYRHIRTYSDGATLTFSVRDLRSSATGVHGHLGILLNNQVLDADNFNIERGSERLTLSNHAFKGLPEVYQNEMSSAQQAQYLTVFTLEATAQWRQRFMAELSQGRRREGGIPLTLDPFIVEKGGIQYFGPPGAGKTYLGLLQAQSINAGVTIFWHVKESPTLYVNLERDREGMLDRLAMVNAILGLPEDAPLPMIHARGQSIKAVQYSIHTSIHEHKIETVFIDSMSRSGMGSLNNDDVANAIIDILNGFGVTWVLIAHSPRADATHAFGSVMQEAGEDVGVQVAHAKHGPEIMGLLLNITKANDIPFSRQYWRMEFDLKRGLVGFTASSEDEFPELGNPDELDMKEKIIAHLESVTQDTGAAMAKKFKVNRGNLSNMLNNDPVFEKAVKTGRNQFFRLKS